MCFSFLCNCGRLYSSFSCSFPNVLSRLCGVLVLSLSLRLLYCYVLETLYCVKHSLYREHSNGVSVSARDRIKSSLMPSGLEIHSVHSTLGIYQKQTIKILKVIKQIMYNWLYYSKYSKHLFMPYIYFCFMLQRFVFMNNLQISLWTWHKSKSKLATFVSKRLNDAE